VNEGPRQKRIRPAPQGRAFRYQRRMAHIVVTVGEVAAKEQGEE
jgi:large subunit ribosomal protein L22